MDTHPLILIADDDFEMRNLLRDWLAADGFRVEEACDGIELVERVARFWLGSASLERPILVVCDVRMPGFSGLSVLRALRQVDPVVPFVVITAFGDAALHEKAARFGATTVIDKPFERGRFMATVACALE